MSNDDAMCLSWIFDLSLIFKLSEKKRNVEKCTVMCVYTFPLVPDVMCETKQHRQVDRYSVVCFTLSLLFSKIHR